MMMRMHNLCDNDQHLCFSRWFASTRMCQKDPKKCVNQFIRVSVYRLGSGCSFDDPQMISQCLLQAAQALGVGRMG